MTKKLVAVLFAVFVLAALLHTASAGDAGGGERNSGVDVYYSFDLLEETAGSQERRPNAFSGGVVIQAIKRIFTPGRPRPRSHFTNDELDAGSK